MQTFFKSGLNAGTGYSSDLGDLFIPRSIFSEGGLWSWGWDIMGQLGSGNTRSSPEAVGDITWKLIAAGEYHTAAIKTDGTLWNWGHNYWHQLGDGTQDNSQVPKQNIVGSNNWKQVACGYYHQAAIKTDGTLWLWGYNAYGQLGTGDITNRSSPVQTIALGTNWKQVSGGYYHTAAIKTDGTLWTWGWNSNGQLGNGNTTPFSSPVQTIAFGTNWKQVGGGGYHTAAIKTDGTLWTWGWDNYGQLGVGVRTNKSSPVQTAALGTNWKLVACGGYYTAAIKTDGTLWTWGHNTSGQLGDNGLINKSSPAQTVALGTNWKQVGGGAYHTTAIKTDGTLWLWGRNNYGQLGTGDITNRSSPVQTIALGTNWKLVAAGNYHTAAIKDDSPF